MGDVAKDGRKALKFTERKEDRWKKETKERLSAFSRGFPKGEGRSNEDAHHDGDRF